jgi:type I restriction enzyme S subunit
MKTSEHRMRFLISEAEERCGDRELELMSVSMTKGVVPRSALTDDLPRAEDLANYKVCHAGDIVVNRMSAYQGALGMSKQTGIVSPDYIVFRPADGVSSKWLHHLMRSTMFVSEMSARIRGIGSIGTGNVRTPRVSSEEIGEIRVAVPNLHVQEAIAQYLDVETARIDAVMSQKIKMIELMQSRWRSAVVHRMNLLIEQFGTIQLKRLVRCLDGRRVPLSVEERSDRLGEFPYFGASGIVDYIDDFLFDETLVLLGEDGAQLGVIDYPIAQVVVGKVWVNNHAHVLRPIAVDPEFLVLHLNTFDRIPYISGGTREKITQDDMNRIPVPNLDLEKQREVARSLVAMRDHSERYCHLLNQQIELLRERRQALITSGVTGELEIPEVAA